MELLKEQKNPLGAEVGCKVNLDKDLFDQVYKPFFVPYIATPKDAQKEMKNPASGTDIANKEACFKDAKKGDKKQLEKYYTLSKQKLKLSRGPKAALQRMKKGRKRNF